MCLDHMRSIALLLALVAGSKAFVVLAPMHATTRASPVMQFSFGKKAPPPEPEPEPEPKAGGFLSGLFGGGSGGRKGDGGGTTSSYGRKAAPASTKKNTKKRVVEAPEKYIEGRSGPQLNPAWQAWKKSQ